MAYLSVTWDPLHEVTQKRRVEPAKNMPKKITPLITNSLEDYFNEMDVKKSKKVRELNPVTDIEHFSAPNTPIDMIRRTPSAQLGKVQIYGLASRYSYRGSAKDTNSSTNNVPQSPPKPIIRKIGTPKTITTSTVQPSADTVSSPLRKNKRIFQKGVARDVERLFEMYIPLHDVVIVDRKVRQLVESRCLHQTHLRRLQFCFESIEVDGAGHVDVSEILEHVGSKQSPFTDELFITYLSDRNSDGTVSFEEFLYIIVLYCTNTKDDILKFCFEAFDQDSNDLISESEYVEMMRCVNGHEDGPLFPGNFRQALKKFDTDKDGFLSYDEFVALEAQYPMVLYPAFSLQDKMSKWTLGEDTWKELMAEYIRNREILKYKLDHDGKLPKDSHIQQFNKFFTKLLKIS